MAALPNHLTRTQCAPVFGNVAGEAGTDAQRAIYIVIPVHNRKALTERFLECLSTQTFRNFAVIVVDDGSTDGTSELISDKFPEVILLRGDGNLWWTGATNMGIRRALLDASADDGILIINDDLEVDPVYLDRLYKVWQSNPNTLVGSVVVDINDPNHILDGGEKIDRWMAKYTKINLGKSLNHFSSDYFVRVSTLHGMGTLIPVHVFREIGLYDDKHFQQCGDYELPFRASNRGYSSIMTYSAAVKLHKDASARINVRTVYSIKDLRPYFFDVKSNFRLKYRIFLARSIATNPIAFCSYVICDLARITFHFASRVRL
jgi:N-acetylglucosaminyl-diphospho-decaprenol L-rhamnosyltransferase